MLKRLRVRRLLLALVVLLPALVPRRPARVGQPIYMLALGLQLWLLLLPLLLPTYDSDHFLRAGLQDPGIL